VRLEHRQEPVADRGIEPQRARVHEPRPRLPGRLEERFQVPTVVGQAREDRGHDHSHVQPGGGEFRDGAQAHRRHRRARLEGANQRHVDRDQRNQDLDVVALGEAAEGIGVARDERALGDDADRQTFVAGEPLQHGARELEATLSWLIRVGGRTDHDRTGRIAVWSYGRTKKPL